MSDAYHANSDHLVKNEKDETIVEQKVRGFYEARPFLIEEKIFDIDLPLNKMRKLKLYEEYNSALQKRIIEAGHDGSPSMYNKKKMFAINGVQKKTTHDQKKSICIHWPVGYDDSVGYSAKEYKVSVNEDNGIGAVNYYVHRDGTILEYGEPEYWENHSSCCSWDGINHNMNVISIEIVNLGYLEERADGLYSGGKFCDLDSSLEGLENPARTCHPFRNEAARHSGLNLPPIPV